MSGFLRRAAFILIIGGVLGASVVALGNINILDNVRGIKVAHAQGADELRSQIESLLSQIATLQRQVSELQGGNNQTFPTPETQTNIFTPIETEITRPTPTSGVCPIIPYTLRRGINVSEVRGLQNFLYTKNYLTPDSVTGYFGPTTESAVQQFQREQGIIFEGTPDTTGYGAVGPRTRMRINELCSVASQDVPTRIVPPVEVEPLQTSESVPVVSVSVSPVSIMSGQSSILRWNSTNAMRCVLKYGSSLESLTHEEIIPVNGTKIVSPSLTTSYFVWCANDPGNGKDGPSSSASATLVVSSSQTQPSIKVLYPNGGETYSISSDGNFSIPFSWKASYALGYPWVYLMNSTTENVPAIASMSFSFNAGMREGVGVFTKSSLVNPGGTLQPGVYWIKVCDQATDLRNPTCDSSDGYFKIVSSGDGTMNKPPVISGITGPTVLKVNESGTWTVKASDPENGPLTYNVSWGDEIPVPTAGAPVPPSVMPKFEQTASFSHTYARAGVYYPSFTVRDNAGNVTPTGLSVKVEGGGDTTSRITVLSPNGGETYQIGKNMEISWNSYNAPADSWVALWLESYNGSGNQFIAQGLPVRGIKAFTITQDYCSGDVCGFKREPGSYAIVARLYTGPSLCDGLCPPAPQPTLISSDKSNAPFSILSGTSSCAPSWTCVGWGSCINGIQNRVCTDQNNCGVKDNMPSVSQTCQSTSGDIPNWQCTDWGSCANGTQSRVCTDVNNLGVTTNKPSTQQPCQSTMSGSMKITVTDALTGVILTNANVTAWQNGIAVGGLQNTASGAAIFNLSAGVYTFAAVAPGYDIGTIRSATITAGQGSYGTIPLSKKGVVTLLSPNGGETLIIGMPYRVTWKTENISAENIIRIGANELSRVDKILLKETANDGVEDIIIPASVKPSTYHMYVEAFTGTGGSIDWSNGTINIVASSSAPTSNQLSASALQSMSDQLNAMLLFLQGLQR